MVSVEKKKVGRPTTEPKVHETRIRMSDNDILRLEYCCEHTGLSKADIIRRGIEEIYRQLQGRGGAVTEERR